jgi:hypothetical protein
VKVEGAGVRLKDMRVGVEDAGVRQKDARVRVEDSGSGTFLAIAFGG